AAARRRGELQARRAYQVEAMRRQAGSPRRSPKPSEARAPGRSQFESIIGTKSGAYRSAGLLPKNAVPGSEPLAQRRETRPSIGTDDPRGPVSMVVPPRGR